jgi:hypothetical protein
MLFKWVKFFLPNLLGALEGRMLHHPFWKYDFFWTKWCKSDCIFILMMNSQFHILLWYWKGFYFHQEQATWASSRPIAHQIHPWYSSGFLQIMLYVHLRNLCKQKFQAKSKRELFNSFCNLCRICCKDCSFTLPSIGLAP